MSEHQARAGEIADLQQLGGRPVVGDQAREDAGEQLRKIVIPEISRGYKHVQLQTSTGQVYNVDADDVDEVRVALEDFLSGDTRAWLFYDPLTQQGNFLTRHGAELVTGITTGFLTENSIRPRQGRQVVIPR